jgi:hypothetical protein
VGVKPKVGQVWIFHAVAWEMLFLLLNVNEHGSFQVFNLETGQLVTWYRIFKFGGKIGEWEAFA